MGAAAVLSKPVDRSELAAALRAHIGSEEGAAVLVVEDDPAVSQLTLNRAVLLHGSAAAGGTRTVTVPGTGPVTVVVADRAGRTVRRYATSSPATVPVLPGGFTVLSR